MVQYHVMAEYLLELCLLDYDMCHYAPSLISAAAIYLALWYVYHEIIICFKYMCSMVGRVIPSITHLEVSNR